MTTKCKTLAGMLPVPRRRGGEPRSLVFKLRISEQDRLQLEAQARGRGMTASAYVRELVLLDRGGETDAEWRARYSVATARRRLQLALKQISADARASGESAEKWIAELGVMAAEVDF